MPDWSPDIADRVRPLNTQPVNQAKAAYVLCWLQQTLRAWNNPAIDAAVDLGNQLNLPVLVYHGVREDYPYASDRLHAFLLGASRDLQQGCKRRGLRCVTYVDRDGHREKGLVYRLADHAAAVVTDDHPVFVARMQSQRFANRCERAVFAVDTARLVPTQMLPEKLSTTPAFRKVSGELRSVYEGHAADFDSWCGLYEGDVCFDDEGLADKSDAVIGTIIAACAIDHSLPPLP